MKARETAVVISTGSNDSGLFETNLRDERLPAVRGCRCHRGVDRSPCRSPFRPFDYDTISDAVLHLRYTAKDGGPELKDVAGEDLDDALNQTIVTGASAGLARVFSLRHEFPTEWYRFLNPLDDAGDLVTTIPLSKERFPLIFRDPRVRLTVSKVQLWASMQPDYLADHPAATIKFSLRRARRRPPPR